MRLIVARRLRTHPGTHSGYLTEQQHRDPALFSVYGHLKVGGISCLADFHTHSAALAWMKTEAARCRLELGFEDFWEHGAKEQLTTHQQIWIRRRRETSHSFATRVFGINVWVTAQGSSVT